MYTDIYQYLSTYKIYYLSERYKTVECSKNMNKKNTIKIYVLDHNKLSKLLCSQIELYLHTHI